MTWTTTERYRAYESYSEDELKTLRERVAQSPWHSTFHIEPETGLLNDPNGFSFFNGKWHLFYQHFP
ncbi:sucrose-6-phosphate hydrolase, partial [Streptococcus suis]